MQKDVARGVAIATTVHDPLGPIAQGRELLRESIYLRELEASKPVSAARQAPDQLELGPATSLEPPAPKISLLDIKVNLAMQRASTDVQFHEDSVDMEIYLEEINKASGFEARKKS